jgi:hypothetical protein
MFSERRFIFMEKAFKEFATTESLYFLRLYGKSALYFVGAGFCLVRAYKSVYYMGGHAALKKYAKYYCSKHGI